MCEAAFSSSSVSKKTVLERADAPVAVDERDLAQARRALVARGVAAQDVGALVGVDAHRAPVAELDLEAA